MRHGAVLPEGALVRLTRCRAGGLDLGAWARRQAIAQPREAGRERDGRADPGAANAVRVVPRPRRDVPPDPTISAIACSHKNSLTPRPDRVTGGALTSVIPAATVLLRRGRALQAP